MGVGERRAVARALACGSAGTGCDARALGADGHTNAAALALVTAALVRGVLRCQQVHLVIGFEGGGLARCDVAALDGDVAVFACARSLDGDIATCVDAGAPGVVCAAVLLALAAAGAQADADARAACFVSGIGVNDLHEVDGDIVNHDQTHTHLA